MDPYKCDARVCLVRQQELLALGYVYIIDPGLPP